jgi:hypothetical protein
MNSCFLSVSAAVSVLALTFSAAYAVPDGPGVIADFEELVRHLESGGSVAVVVDLDAVGLVAEYGEDVDVELQMLGFMPTSFSVYRYSDRTEGYTYLAISSTATLVNTPTGPIFETMDLKISNDGSVEIGATAYYSAIDSFSELTAKARLASTPEDPAGVYVYRR